MNKVIQAIRCRVGHLVVNKRPYCSFNDEKLSQAGYWTHRYRQIPNQQQSFDWFLPGDEVHQLLKTYLSELAKTWGPLRIMDLGCGNSSLPRCLYTLCVDSPVDLHLVDYVADVLHTQHGWLTGSPKGHPTTTVQYVQCDVTHLPYRKEQFHLVVDKGTTDAVLKDRVFGHGKCHQILNGVVDILHAGGIFLQITDEDPDSRLVLLEEVLTGRGVSFSEVISEGREYFVFRYKKVD